MKLTHRTVNQSVIRSGGLPAGHDFLSAIHRYGNVLNQVCRRKRVHTRNTHTRSTHDGAWRMVAQGPSAGPRY